MTENRADKKHQPRAPTFAWLAARSSRLKTHYDTQRLSSAL